MTREKDKTGRKRQKKVANKRVDSGLKQTKLYLDVEVYNLLMQLGEQMGYQEIRKEKKQGRIEQLSQVVTNCILNHPDAPDSPIGREAKYQITQKLYFLRNICRYRRTQGDNDQQIADFMQEKGHPHPLLITKGKKPKNGWQESDIERLLDAPDELEEYFARLNHSYEETLDD